MWPFFTFLTFLHSSPCWSRSPGQYSGIAPQHCDQHAQAVELGVKEHMQKKKKSSSKKKLRWCIFIQSIPTKTSFKGTSKKFEDVLGHIPRIRLIQVVKLKVFTSSNHWSRDKPSPRPPLRAMQSCPHKVPLPPPLMQPWDQSCDLYWFKIYCALNFLFPSEIVSTESYFVKLSQLNTVYQVGSSHTMSSVCRIYWKSSTQKDGGFFENGILDPEVSHVKLREVN